MKLTLFDNFLTVTGNSVVGNSWEKYLSSQNMKFKWLQLMHILPREWKEAISMHHGSFENLLIQDHHLIKKNQMLCLNKLKSNKLYKIQIVIKDEKPTSQSYFERFLKIPI